MLRRERCSVEKRERASARERARARAAQCGKLIALSERGERSLRIRRANCTLPRNNSQLRALTKGDAKTAIRHRGNFSRQLLPEAHPPKCMQSREMNRPALSLCQRPRLSQRDAIIVLAKAKIKDADSRDLSRRDGSALRSYTVFRSVFLSTARHIISSDYVPRVRARARSNYL